MIHPAYATLLLVCQKWEWSGRWAKGRRWALKMWGQTLAF